MSGSSRAVIGALLGAATLAAPSAAGAATLRGTVVAPPAVHGRSAVVPVLTGSRTVKVVVPRGVIRTRTARIAADGLRFGDRVTVTGRRLTGSRPRARTLRVTRRGPTVSFEAIAERRDATYAAVRAALTRLQSLGDVKGSADELRRVRTDVNVAIADLRKQADALDAVVAAATPAARGSDAYLGALRDAAASARKAADDLDAAVAKLDQAINDTGPPSAEPALPIGVGTVSDVLHAVLDVLRGLG